MDTGWNFPNNNNSEIVGIGEAGIETFKGSLFSSLAREICQNSLDARVDLNKPVKIDFILSNISRQKIYGINDLTDAVKLCKDFWIENKKTVDFFTNAIKICENSDIRVLRISDFNTTGLTGSDKIKSSAWQDLVKSSGVSNKGGDLGGSFGIGKSAPFACSDLRTIFYNTLDMDGLKAYQGVAKLVSFQTNDKKGLFSTIKGDMKQGKGYYGEISDNSAVKSIINLDGYTRTEKGTDVYILGFVNHSEWKDNVIKSVIEGYLISILQNDLEVTIDDIVINNTTIDNLMEKYKDSSPLTYNYYQVLTDTDTVKITEDFQGLGNLELNVLVKKDFRRKVLMARSNGMKIFDKANISGSIQFAAVCILRDKNLNEYFRKMENPQHNDWESDRYSDDEKLKNQAKKKKAALFKFIKEKVKEIGRSTILDEMDAVGAGEFIPDIDTTNGVDGAENESINNEIRGYSPIEKNKKSKIEKGSQVVEETEVSSDDYSQGIFDDESDEPITDYEHGNGHIHNGGGENEDGQGRNDETGNLPMQSSVSIKPLKLRVFMFNQKENLYKLSFTPNKSAKNAYIEISISGEQSNSNVEIIKAMKLDKTSLISKSNKIFVGDLEENKTYSVLYSIKYNEKCSMGVVVHGYKI